MKTLLVLASSCIMAALLSPATTSAFGATAKPADSAKVQTVIAQNGKSSYVIALASDAIPAEKTAAHQLQQYLREATGATLPLQAEGEIKPDAPQILVGTGKRVKQLLLKQNWNALGSDGIVIKSVGNKLVLAGGRPRGALYAVFQFLEDSVGCRWWSPEAKFIPRKETLAIPGQNLVYRSPFDYRENHAAAPQQDAVFATILRENGHHQPQTAEWGGHYNLLGFVHTFELLLPQTTYFKDHPEWYTDPENGSKPCTTTSKMPIGQETQLCLSNPQVLDELAKQALLLIAKNPDAGYISISQNDSDAYCCCPDCAALALREGSQSGPIIAFVNKVAARIHSEYPDFLVETLAYRRSEKPPRTIRPAANVLVRQAPYFANFGHPINSNWNQKPRDSLLQWAKIAPNLFVWSYVTNFNSSLMPHPNWDGLGKDLRFFAANNVKGIFAQGNVYNNSVGDFARMRVWLMGKLMWNPKLDQTALTDEFLKGYYGNAAAPYLKEYIAVIERAFLKKKNLMLTAQNRDFSFLGMEDLNSATRLFNKAAAATEFDKVLAGRVARERLSLDAAWLVCYRAAKDEASRTGREFLGPADPRAALTVFVQTAKSYGAGQWGDGMPLEKQMPVIEGRFREKVPLPEFAQKLPESDIADLQDLEYRLHMRGKISDFLNDPAASDGSAATVIGDSESWAIQVELNQTSVGVAPEAWRIYAYIRAQMKPGASSDGAGMIAGVYDDTFLPPAGITSQPIALKPLAGDRYYRVDLGVKSIRKTSYIWFAPQRNLAVERFFIDRVILVREPSEKR